MVIRMRSSTLGLLGLLSCLIVLWAVVEERTPGIAGIVMASGKAVAAARVRYQTLAESVETDACGRFHLGATRQGQRITAWKEGYRIGGARPGGGLLEIELLPLPREDHANYSWVPSAPDSRPGFSSNCGNCHRSIYAEWRESGHSRSISGMHFRNLYEGTDAHNRPGVGWGVRTQYEAGAAVCLTCHAPSLEDAVEEIDAFPAQSLARDGVHCDYCHKVAGAGRQQIGLRLGRFNLQLLRPPPGEQLFLGPLDDVDRGEDTYSPLYKQSLYCASCHEGTVFGVHAYSTYSEWLESPARRQGQECQSCHMKPTGVLTNLAPGHGGLERDPATLGNHRFLEPSLKAMLQQCLHLETGWSHRDGGLFLDLTLEARNVGHRVPTGFPDRQLLLIVAGRDGEQQPVPLAGPRLPALAGALLENQSGKLFAKILHDAQNRQPAPFWRAVPEMEDHRLHPHQPDRSSWEVPPGTERVEIRLVSRRFWEETRVSKQWPVQDLVIFQVDLVVPR